MKKLFAFSMKVIVKISAVSIAILITLILCSYYEIEPNFHSPDFCLFFLMFLFSSLFTFLEIMEIIIKKPKRSSQIVNIAFWIGLIGTVIVLII